MLAGSRSAPALLLVIVLGVARAEEQPAPPTETPQRFQSAVDNAEAGNFLPESVAPRIVGHGVVSILSGYDSAYSAATLNANVEARVWGPIALRAGASYVGATNSVLPTAGVRVQALAQEKHGVDLTVAAFYKPEGLTASGAQDSFDGEIETVVSVGRRFGRLGLVLNAIFGSDLDGSERDGEVRLGGLYTLSDRLRLGVDTRVRFDLASDPAKIVANHRASYDLVAGPTASYLIGPVALVAQAGYSGTQLYGSSRFASGVLALGGVAAAF